MKRVFKYLDKPLLIISIILFVVGLIMVFSSSNVTAYMTHAASPYNYFIKLKHLFFDQLQKMLNIFIEPLFILKKSLLKVLKVRKNFGKLCSFNNFTY